ncbi:unnamed protein product [Strongylus vulgaris]|uniref:Uncharacterized protein n=1 Tax=Strongylus vulgaris TaxID=40348 RepID=A0A3P7K564_STRVU|nr:unnamed protein product [Strongylus vulgaris]
MIVFMSAERHSIRFDPVRSGEMGFEPYTRPFVPQCHGPHLSLSSNLVLQRQGWLMSITIDNIATFAKEHQKIPGIEYASREKTRFYKFPTYYVMKDKTANTQPQLATSILSTAAAHEPPTGQINGYIDPVLEKAKIVYECGSLLDFMSSCQDDFMDIKPPFVLPALPILPKERVVKPFYPFENVGMVILVRSPTGLRIKSQKNIGDFFLGLGRKRQVESVLIWLLRYKLDQDNTLECLV